MKEEVSKTFQDLIVWQKFHRFVLDFYLFSGNFTKAEVYGLTSQLRRAAISIPANSAEDFKRKSLAEKAQFINIAQSSLEKCRYVFDSSEGFRIWQHSKTPNS
jgi:four helix bundle protein